MDAKPAIQAGLPGNRTPARQRHFIGGTPPTVATSTRQLGVRRLPLKSVGQGRPPPRRVGRAEARSKGTANPQGGGFSFAGTGRCHQSGRSPREHCRAAEYTDVARSSPPRRTCFFPPFLVTLQERGPPQRQRRGRNSVNQKPVKDSPLKAEPGVNVGMKLRYRGAAGRAKVK